MLIELQPLGSFPTTASIGIFMATLLFSVALSISLRREGKAMQAVVVPSVLLVVFFCVLLYELRRVYSLEHKDGLLVTHTLLGSTATACVDIEFLIQRTRSQCTVSAYRGNEKLFHSVAVDRSRCDELGEQLHQMPCKPSDRPKASQTQGR